MCTVVKKAKAQSKQSKQGQDSHMGSRQEARLNRLIFLYSNPGIYLGSQPGT